MPWIESHTVLLRHRKLIALAKDLRLKPVYVLGHLHALWHSVLEQADNGDLSSWTDEFIAESAYYTGDAPQFVQLLQKHKWLDGKLIHDWLDYASKYLREYKYRRNPEKMSEIDNIHKSKKDMYMTQSEVVIDTLPNLTLPNQPDHNIYMDFEKSIFEKWNLFVDKYPVLSKIKEITSTRRKSVKTRFSQESFKNFDQILDCISKQKFLLGENKNTWKVSFDWLIENDTNHVKVLEMRYISTQKNICSDCRGTGEVISSKGYKCICPKCKGKKEIEI